MLVSAAQRVDPLAEEGKLQRLSDRPYELFILIGFSPAQLMVDMQYAKFQLPRVRNAKEEVEHSHRIDAAADRQEKGIPLVD